MFIKFNLLLLVCGTFIYMIQFPLLLIKILENSLCDGVKVKFTIGFHFFLMIASPQKEKTEPRKCQNTMHVPQLQVSATATRTVFIIKEEVNKIFK